MFPKAFIKHPRISSSLISVPFSSINFSIKGTACDRILLWISVSLIINSLMQYIIYSFVPLRAQQVAEVGREGFKAREALTRGEKFFEPRKRALEKSFRPRSLNAYPLSLKTHRLFILGGNERSSRLRGGCRPTGRHCHSHSCGGGGSTRSCHRAYRTTSCRRCRHR